MDGSSRASLPSCLPIAPRRRNSTATARLRRCHCAARKRRGSSVSYGNATRTCCSWRLRGFCIGSLARYPAERARGALAQPTHGIGIYLQRRSRSLRTPLRPAVRCREDRRMTGPLSARISQTPKSALSPQIAEGRIVIEAVSPMIDCGETPIKRIVGDTLAVQATVFSDGHDKIAVALLYRPQRETDWRRAPMRFVENDRWTGSFPLEENARYVYTIESWRDPFASWQAALEKKRAAGQDLSLDLEHGLDLIRETKPRSRGAVRERDEIIAAAESAGSDAAGLLLEPRVLAFMTTHGRRDNVSRYGRELMVIVDRKTAAFSSWYELFPRSQTPSPRQLGTFNGVIARLPYVRDLGFDVLYFPPVHPIGRTNRKGRNNALSP